MAADEAAAAAAAVDKVFPRHGCCCLPLSSSVRRRGCTIWERIHPSAAGKRGDVGHYYGWGWRALLKMREWSELVAGPRWKTFIRRFGRGGARRAVGNKFQYDPLSYALNFDDGGGSGSGGGDSDGDGGYRGFSARYVAPPASAKSSMDLGGRDAPLIFEPSVLRPLTPFSAREGDRHP